MVKTAPFADISVAVPGFGAMSFSHAYGPANDDDSKKTLTKAVELGCTFWDSAVVYGGGHNEALLGEYLKEHPGTREKVFIASKCGVEVDFETKERNGIINNSAAHINEYIEGTIKRLGSPPDLYYLHRIEPGRSLDESIGALDGLRKAGKTKYIGLSECGAETLRKACAVAKIDAIQIEYSPWFTDHEQNGLIDTAREFGVTIVAFSPLGRGILTGKYQSSSDFGEGDFRRTIPSLNEENLSSNMRIVQEFKKLADKKGCTSGQLALAWVIAQGAIPIPGTRSAERLTENFGATDIELSEAELKVIRSLVEDAKPKGARYGEIHMKDLGH